MPHYDKLPAININIHVFKERIMLSNNYTLFFI